VYLKRLEIQGFKSFPTRTVFEFGPGITAIIGPNGSGKSNVADALRWVLGEQNPRAMRLRKLDDALFAGGHKRPPAGFAEVSLWLDNSDRWLPVDYTEVVVTRRLHRSGEMDYLINRQRVRLRDITELFLKARLGQNSYALMGQGLVDQVLSLKPEERRALIEEAADVRRYRLRIEEAQDRLAATQENLEKVDLLVAEIAPRLAQLERQARRAHEHEVLTRELAEALRAWFASRRRAAEEALVAARAAYDQRNAAFAAAQAELDRLEERLTAVRARLAEERRAEQAARARLHEVEERARGIQQRLRLEEERLGFVLRRLEELEGEVGQLEAERAALREHAPDDGAEPDEAGLAALRETVRARQTELAAFDAARERERHQVGEAEQAVRRCRAQLRDAEERVTALERQLRRFEEEQAANGQRQRLLLGRLKDYGQRYLGRLRALYAAEDRALAAEQEREQARHAVAAARDEVAALEQAVQALTASVEEHRRRLLLLERMREHARGVDAGAQAVLAQAEREGRPRVLGLLGEQVRVPRGLEVALEAALAEYISAVLVPEQRDAWAALQILAEAQNGRATLIPLDGLKPLPALNLASERGVVGVAARFVRCDPRLRDVVDTLLGRFIVVEDVETGRTLLRRGLGTVVTLDGIVLRPNGTITGGRAALGGGRFGIERELAEVPAQIEQALAAQRQREAELGRARQRLAAARAVAADVDAAAEAARRELLRAREALFTERAGIAPLRADLRHLRETAAQGGRRVAELATELERAQARRTAAARALTEAERRLATLRERVDDTAVVRDALERALTEARGTLAALEREQAALAALHRSRRAALARLDERLAARRREAEARRQEIAVVEADCARLRGELASAAAARAQAEAELASPQERVRALEREIEELEPLAVQRRRALADLERACLNAESELHRRAQELERLREEMAAEGLVWEAAPEGATGNGHHQPALGVLSPYPSGSPLPRAGEGMGVRVGTAHAPLADGGTSATEVVADPAALAERIRALRARIRALGPVNAQAQADYAESKERHDFLVEQVRDLRAAEESLKQTLDELRGHVRERFRATFQRVGAEFQESFKAFFGGGNARLVLTEPEDYGESGVDIIARPPGKRLQSLSLLSGGERAMTAVALLFALLQANPAPFCVLDEVDAALDEANVGRFGEALKRLAERTQFIVITHNRLTIQAADTIYGVSMGRDGVSSVLSLRLADVPE
jgi:chromosome segregation protein